MPKQQEPANAAHHRRIHHFRADGQWWRYEKGEDYAKSGSSFATAARAWASRNGYRLASRSEDGGNVVFLRFTRRDS